MGLKNFCKYFLRSEYRRNVNMRYIIKHNSSKILKPLCVLLRWRLYKRNIIISKAAKGGHNPFFPHPQNIIIGRAIFGSNCIIYHDVTIGQNKGKYPKIGNNVIIYPGAKIIGDITIGDNCIIGCNAVVTKSFEDNSIVGGVPARLIKMRSEDDEYY